MDKLKIDTQNLRDAASALKVIKTEFEDANENSNTLADADGLGTVTYQWLRDGTATGSTGATFVLSQADVGKQISAKAVYTDLLGTAEAVTSAQTAAVANVNDAPTGAVTITGTATQNQTGTTQSPTVPVMP